MARILIVDDSEAVRDGLASMGREDFFGVLAERNDAIDAPRNESIDPLAKLGKGVLPTVRPIRRELILENRVRDIDHRCAGKGSRGEADDRRLGVVRQHDIKATIAMSADVAGEQSRVRGKLR